jgi:hypothetical protein
MDAQWLPPGELLNVSWYVDGSSMCLEESASSAQYAVCQSHKNTPGDPNVNPILRTTTLGKCFSNFHMDIDYLEILLNCSFYSRCECTWDSALVNKFSSDSEPHFDVASFQGTQILRNEICNDIFVSSVSLAVFKLFTDYVAFNSVWFFSFSDIIINLALFNF